MKRSKQGELPLWRGKWGGWRPGAGRKPGPKPPVPHERRGRFPAAHPCLVTLKVMDGLSSLRTRDVVREVEGSFRRGAERGMRSLGARFARAVNRALRRSGPVVRERYHLVVLRTPTQVRNALRYVLLNARRHWAKRRGSKALPGPVRLDPASSARWFGGWRSASVGAEEASEATDAPAVRPARTWLLSAGWRRLGLLDPAEVPG